MGLDKVLDEYRKISFSERNKGERFERLMQAFLKTDSRYTSELKDVWLWNEFPFKKELGGKDTGIDIVAKTYAGEFWAIQCKCYSEDAYIDKKTVDTFLSTSSKFFHDDNGAKLKFSQRLWISTTNKWNSEAENTINNQDPPVARLSLFELETAPVDWEILNNGIYGSSASVKKKQAREHQKEAIQKAHQYFKTADRGKLIMACGTGKTFTSLKIAEEETNNKGFILFLVPSIALLGQTLNEWYAEAKEEINAICICSDSGVSKKVSKNEDCNVDSITNLALPASTDVKAIEKQFCDIKEKLKNFKKDGMVVVFSTYQSIDVISKAQQKLIKNFGDDAIFDLVICDEAHRTTGVILESEEESAFTKVHDNKYIKAKKRLYMTATPRLYNDNAKEKAKLNDCILCSMDDERIYGEEFYRIGFGEAVEKNLLSDYKVLVLTISENQVSGVLQEAIADSNEEINADDAAKLVGCINALSKQMIKDTESESIWLTDPKVMHTAVAFCRTISESKEIKVKFNACQESFYKTLKDNEKKKIVKMDVHHVDGGMGATQRAAELSWLRSASTDGKECRVLTNVRCLSEGVDVPSLDAVMFLSAKNSQVDVVQSVGRVMRKAPNKKYGYIIIPVVIPSNVGAEESLNNNDRFKVVWTVLNSLRAHDDRFNAMVNKIELNKKGGNVIVGCSGVGGGDPFLGDNIPLSENINFLKYGEFKNAFYARMVQKVGDKRYWEQWAKDIASIAEKHVDSINKIIKEKKYRKDFDSFIDGLHTNINPYISEQEAIEMLAQHIITKPVFEALFENNAFVQKNPVSLAMQKILNVLDQNVLNDDYKVLASFYKDVRKRCEGIDNAEGKQKIIIELYDKFFKTALPKTVEKLGIVYTPVEVVDFIINSVSDILKQEFNRDISDENVHVLDPFTGTGTFITRLLQSGRIKEKDIKRKYTNEIHANEIVLLAYYIASINIENAFHDLVKAKKGDYTSFDGICLTDTFQLGEEDDGDFEKEQFFEKNVKRVKVQKKSPITVIIGNPPYSIGQKSENDNAKNQSYPRLNSKIANSYAKYSNATLNKGLYDSYIKAFRWATDRLDKNGGVIGFVTNGQWLDTVGMDGFRCCLEREFSSIYIFNLRGNQRTSGELSRKEGGKIFGSGSRTPIAITLLVKNPKYKNGKATIYYHDIGDYLSQQEKLAKIADFTSIKNPNFKMDVLIPNKHNDWLKQRNEVFNTFIPLGGKDKKNKNNVFSIYSGGVVTSRDPWCYNSSLSKLESNLKRMILFYNQQRLELSKINGKIKKIEDYIDKDEKKISWSRALKKDLSRGIIIKYDDTHIYESLYRPFFKQQGYVDSNLNECRYQMPKIFPTADTKNICIIISGTGASKDFSALTTNFIPSLDTLEKSQCFPLYWYRESESSDQATFLCGDDEHIKEDGVTDYIFKLAKEKYSTNKITKEDIFYYVYGLLHSEDYRTQFSSDVKKMLARIPLVCKFEDFNAFSKAGRSLANLHLNYESQKPYAKVKVTGTEKNVFIVKKMKFKSKEDKSTIFYNDYITISNIPDVAYEYIVNGKSAIEWIIERYQVSVDKASQINNDPNDWALEHNNPRYVLDLLLSIITVSIESVKIINSLPMLVF